MSKKLNKQLTTENIQVANKHMKTSSITCTFKEIKIKQ